MILVLAGSPNQFGNTNTVLNELLKDTKEEVIIYDAFTKKIQTCTDCKYCSYKSGCSIKDEMLDLYQLIERTSTLIIASPLYFATFSGELINLISRFQTYYSGKYVRKATNPHIKKALLLVTAGGYWPSMFVGVKETFNILKLLFSITDSKTLLISKCDDYNPLQSEEFKTYEEEIKSFLTQ